MNDWRILEIEPTADLKSIKKAYALLLKSNKPDVNPEGFSRLHSAYKRCLANAKFVTTEEPDAPQGVVEKSIDQSHAEQTQPLSNEALGEQACADKFDELERSNAPIPVSIGAMPEASIANVNESASDVCIGKMTELDSPLAPSENDYENVVDVACEAFSNEAFEQDRLALNESVDRAMTAMQSSDALNAWRFLAESESLYDLQFKMQFSDDLFDRWLDFLGHSHIDPAKRKESLLYINEQLGWLDMRLHFENEYGYDEILLVFNILEETENLQERQLKWTVEPRHKGQMERGNYYARVAAMAMDIIIFVMVFYSVNLNDDVVESFLLLLVCFVAINATLEASPMQGGFGKILFGLKVTKLDGRRINILQSLFRQLFFVIFTAAFKITFWVNLFLGDGRFLHDRLSRSCIIKR